MKKNIVKIIIGLVLVVGAIVSFNVEAKANIKENEGLNPTESKCNYIKRTNTKCVCKGTGSITCTC